MKETRLKEDAAIYSKRQDNISEKEKWVNLDSREKVQYFKDYYLKFVIAGALVLAFIIWLLYSMLKPRPDTVLTVTLINSTMTDEASEALSASLSEYLDINRDKEEIFVDTSLFFDEEHPSEATMASQQKFMAYAMNGEFDIIIAQEDVFETYAANGYFINLAEALPSNLYSQFNEVFYMGKVTDTDTEDSPYGIYISGYQRFENLESYIQNPVIGIMANTKHKTNSVKGLQWLTETN